MLSSFLGNEKLKNELEELAALDRFPHAMSISGQAGTGCGLLADLVAETYLRDSGGLCRRKVHPDFVNVEGSGSSGMISVDDIRNALYEMHKAAVMADGRRVLCIRHCENLNASSSNAILKMMEEPPEGVMFILTVRRRDDLLPTIRSRAVDYHVLPLDQKTCVSETLKRVPGCTAEKAEEMSRIFGGRLGMVLKALSDPKYSDLVNIAEHFCSAALEKKEYECLVWLSNAETRDDLNAVLDISVSLLKNRLSGHPEEAGRIGAVHEAVEEAAEFESYFGNQKLAVTRLARKVSR